MSDTYLEITLRANPDVFPDTLFANECPGNYVKGAPIMGNLNSGCIRYFGVAESDLSYRGCIIKETNCANCWNGTPSSAPNADDVE